MSLSLKQRKFVDAYLSEANGNATRAAEIAGYKDPEQAGYENKRKQEIQAEIERRYAENTLSKNEVLTRLSDQARGVGEFIVAHANGTISLDFARMEAAGKMHLIHAIKRTQFGDNIEFYDAQAALRDIGRHHKLFTDRTESDVNVTLYDHLSDAQLEQFIAEAEAGKTPQIPSAES